MGVFNGNIGVYLGRFFYGQLSKLFVGVSKTVMAEVGLIICGIWKTT